jgi:sortase (surface protein transpeptidase)
MLISFGTTRTAQPDNEITLYTCDLYTRPPDSAGTARYATKGERRKNW